VKPSKRDIEDENRKMRYLRLMIDCTTAVLAQSDISITEAIDLIAKTKRATLALFPGKEDTFDLIYKPRFERLMKSRFNSN